MTRFGADLHQGDARGPHYLPPNRNRPQVRGLQIRNRLNPPGHLRRSAIPLAYFVKEMQRNVICFLSGSGRPSGLTLVWTIARSELGAAIQEKIRSRGTARSMKLKHRRDSDSLQVARRAVRHPYIYPGLNMWIRQGDALLGSQVLGNLHLTHKSARLQQIGFGRGTGGTRSHSPHGNPGPQSSRLLFSEDEPRTNSGT
jgi:hypothetical protein